MRYLLYYQAGYIKKFPLQKPEIVIGRGASCDIVLVHEDMSRQHCRIGLEGDRIHVQDLNSRNGTWSGRKRIKEVWLNLNESFAAGGTEFFFKQGDSQEFELHPDLSAVLASMGKFRRSGRKNTDETEDALDKYQLLLCLAAEKSFTMADPLQLLESLQEELMLLIHQGTLCGIFKDRQSIIFNYLQLPEAVLEQIRHQVLQGHPAELSCSGKRLAGRYFQPANRKIHCGLLFIDDRSQPVKRRRDDFFEKLSGLLDVNVRLSLPETLEIFHCDCIFREGELVIMGKSAAIRQLSEMIRRIAAKNNHVLILGETGTGKELFARMIHKLSGRGNYVAVNCAAIPANLIESELFGYEPGAFTDARQRKRGKIEEASGGTLVLDELGEMPAAIQAKLLRVIQERNLARLGGNEIIPVDLRIISLTNQDLYRAVEEKRFREDLFFRLRVHELTIPPLRERPEDIVPLVTFFAGQLAGRSGVIPGGFSQSVYQCLTGYSWPGNVRELENEIIRIMDTIDDHEIISDHHILPRIRQQSALAVPELQASLSFQEKMLQTERDELQRLLTEQGGNKSKVSRILGMSYPGFLKKLRRLGLE